MSELKAHNWKPILFGRSALDAWNSVLAVANELRSHPSNGKSAQALCESALLFGYLSKAEPSGPWRDLAMQDLNSAIELTSSIPQRSLSLYEGLSGIGWMAEHIRAILNEGLNDHPELDNDSLDEIDDAVIRFLHKQDSPVGNYDLIGGVVGYGVYFIERLPRATAFKSLEAILQILDVWAERLDDGIAWHTPPRWLPETQRAKFHLGYYNLGVAHGVPGVQQFLSQLIGIGIEESLATVLLESSTKWLLARQRRPDALSTFGWTFVPGQETSDSRLAWCYGDLGIAAVLHQTGSQLGRSEWIQFAQNLLDQCTVWPTDKDGIRDTGLCHGALGVAHIFNRIYQCDSKSQYRQAAVSWFERGLKMKQSALGGAGFFSWKADSNPPRCVPDLSFLTGAVGAALALLAAITESDPSWDRLLLLSGREIRSKVKSSGYPSRPATADVSC